MKHLLTPLLLSLLLCSFTACSSTSDIMSAGLRVELTRIQRDSTGGAQATWRVYNPNVVSYLFAKSTHKLTLDGVVVGTITDDSRLGVPQGSQVERTAALTLVNAAAAGVIERALAQGSAAYRLDSTLLVLIVDDDIEKIPLQAAGSVPVTAK